MEPHESSVVEEEHVRKILTRIESFILPSKQSFEGALPTTLAPTSSSNTRHIKHRKENSTVPLDRLDDTLYQLALADHVRTLQTLYRDNYDDQYLGRELRGVDFKSPPENNNQDSLSNEAYEKLPTKQLLEKMIEGRSRALALLRLCFGENSHSMVRGKIDLANTYALTGQWEQAEDRIVQALNQLVSLEEYEENILYRQRKRISIIAAQRIVTVFQVLRDHVISNHGQVNRSLLEELHAAFATVMNADHPDHVHISHPAKLLASLTEFFNATKSKLPLKQLTTSYFHDSDQPNHNAQPKSQVKTWGDIINFLRNQCEVMRSYIQYVNFSILPQNKAILLLPFRLCDSAGRNLAHPGHLASVVPAFPSVMKLISGSDLCKVLTQIRVVVPLVVNAHTGSVQNLHTVSQSSPGKSHTPKQHVGYELPITIEEFLSLYLLECQPMALDNQFKLLKIQVLSIKGVCSINIPNQLVLAEEILTQALRYVEELGYENEVLACELYNAIAQMMISKYQTYITNKKLRFKGEAEEWMLQTEEGKRMVRIQLKVLKKQFNYKAPPMAHAEMEYRAKAMILKNRIKFLLDKKDSENDQLINNLQAAYRYLVMSYEILDGNHGSFHPITATACMAIASVQNILKDYESTREWLVKAIRIMEKASSASSMSVFFPTPIRAITFAQVQLSHVLSKLGYDEEGRRVLYKAADFQMQLSGQLIEAFHASKQLVNIDKSPNDTALKNAQYPVDHPLFTNYTNAPDTARSHTSRASISSETSGNNKKISINPREKFISLKKNLPNEEDQNLGGTILYAGNYSLVLPIIIKNTPLDEEIQLAISLSNQIIEMSIKNGDKWEASNQCERIAQLCEKAFGWDSIEAAESYRQVIIMLK
jgi:hypothetical protein